MRASPGVAHVIGALIAVIRAIADAVGVLAVTGDTVVIRARIAVVALRGLRAITIDEGLVGAETADAGIRRATVVVRGTGHIVVDRDVRAGAHRRADVFRALAAVITTATGVARVDVCGAPGARHSPDRSAARAPTADTTAAVRSATGT
jgi:hypothetical protein